MTTGSDPRSALAQPGRGDAAGPGPATPDRPRARTRAGQALQPGRGSGPRFGGLLLILVFTYLLSAFLAGIVIDSLQVLLFLVVVLLALRIGRLSRRAFRITAAGLVVGSVAAAASQLADRTGPGAGVANSWTALVLLLAAVLIVRRVLDQPDITLQSIYGAVSAYLVLGLMFSAVYAAMYRFGGDTFFANGQHGDTQTFQYFSFVTLTTTGYGDFTAAGSGGRAVAVLEAITGQIFLATLVARLVAGFRGSARRAASRARASQTQASKAPAGPAGARRASTRRAGASGLIGLRPPGTARRRRPDAVSGDGAARTGRR
jgi:Ion channel